MRRKKRIYEVKLSSFTKYFIAQSLQLSFCLQFSLIILWCPNAKKLLSSNIKLTDYILYNKRKNEGKRPKTAIFYKTCGFIAFSLIVDQISNQQTSKKMLQMINRQWLLQLKQAQLAVKIYKMLLIMSLLHFIYNINICSLLLLLMPQRKIWTQEQDRILKLLKEQRGQKKWSTIAKAMQRDFGLFGRTGKQCRERYHNHLDSSIVSAEWTRSQEDILYEQHEQVGNKWSIIAQNLPGRSDNCVKNHFYSKLRKAVRKLNKIIFQRFANYYHQFNISLLYKIIQTSQQKFKINSKINEDIIADCNNIKNQLYRFDSLGKQNQKRDYKIKRLIQNIAQYEARLKKNTKTYKKHKVSIETNASQSEIPQENEREQGSNIVKREDQEVSYYKQSKRYAKKQLFLRTKVDLCISSINYEINQQTNTINIYTHISNTIDS